MAFDKLAERKNAKLRLAFEGPSGSGKTMTALLLAAALGCQKIGVADSERGSASKYAGLPGVPPFFAENLEEKSLDEYRGTLTKAAMADVDGLIIDSYSHSWLGALEQVDRMGGNKFTNGWKIVSPAVVKLTDAILTYPGHVIATLRVQTAYETQKDERTGKVAPVKVGLKPVAREGTDYEFDVVLALTVDGTISVTKSRCPGLTGVYTREQLPTIAKVLNAWLSDGAALSLADALADELRGASDAEALKRVGVKVSTAKDKLTDAEREQLRALYAARKNAIESDAATNQLGDVA